jgi:hypothetical protein
VEDRDAAVTPIPPGRDLGDIGGVGGDRVLNRGLSKDHGRRVLLSSNVHGNNSEQQCVVLPDTQELVLVARKRATEDMIPALAHLRELPFQRPLNISRVACVVSLVA